LSIAVELFGVLLNYILLTEPRYIVLGIALLLPSSLDYN